MNLGIELFRGIAALMVLVTHYARFVTTGETGLTFLWTGVDLFFVISGFVFAPMALGRPVAVVPYLVRRFFRLYPLYAVAVVSYFFFTPEVAEKNAYLVRHLLFLHTTRSIEEAYFFNPAFWSLPVEIEFYLALPLVALLGGARKKLALLSGLALTLSVAVNLNRGPEVDAYRILGAHLTGILPEFLVGVFLYHFVQRGVKRRTSLLIALGGCALIAFEYLTRYGGMGLNQIALINATFNFLCALGYAMIMFPVLRVANENYRPALKNLAVFCGAISYGVYLFHNLIPAVLAALGLEQSGAGFFALSTLLTIAAALAGYKLIENPARRYGRTLSRRMLHGASEARVSPGSKAAV